MALLDYFRILKALIILFLLFVCINYVPNQNGKVLEEKLAGFNSDDGKTTLRRLRCFKMTSPFFVSSSKISPYSSLTLLQTIESKRVNEGSMWSTGQTSNNSVINIRWWRNPLPSGPSLALLDSNSWLETHFILLLAKIIEYT